jgi:hypothetical protein
LTARLSRRSRHARDCRLRGHLSGESKAEPHEPRRDDGKQHSAHRLCRPPVTFNPSRLPVPPAGFGVRDDRSLSRHRRASRMISDMVWGGSFHLHIMTIGGRMATPARTSQLGSGLRFPAIAARHTAKTQTVPTTALIDKSCILLGYAPSPNGAVSECTLTPQRLECPSDGALDALCTSAQTAVCRSARII